ncbi:MAG: TlpA family protein disulfide reductase [Candidatus Binatia bacterium]
MVLFIGPLVAIFVVIGVAAFRAGPKDVGSPAPAIDLARLDAPGRISTTGLGGRPYVLNFWASWCLPCREEAPMLARVVGTGSGSPAFIGVNILDGRADAVAFIEQFEIRYPNGWDNRGAFRNFRVAGVPETIFVGRDGRIAGRWIGAIDESTLRRLLSELRTLPPGRILHITGSGPRVSVR